MFGMAKNINGKGNEQEFDSDLETAKALSLESLALEQFRKKKEQSYSRVPQKIERKKNHQVSKASNLIDLHDPNERFRDESLSVLEAFDPLMSRSSAVLPSAVLPAAVIPPPVLPPPVLPPPVLPPAVLPPPVLPPVALPSEPFQSSSCYTHEEPKEESLEQNIYNPYDPFDYFYSPPSRGSQHSDPIYSAVIKVPQQSTGPPVPPRNVLTFNDSQDKHSNGFLFDQVTPLHNVIESLCDSDLKEFIKMVKTLRGAFQYSDASSNIGLIMSPVMESFYKIGTSLKIIVHSEVSTQPVVFTCDVSTSIEHIISHVTCELELLDGSEYLLKIKGREEYLDSKATLINFEYAHQCIKLEEDVSFCLVSFKDLQRTLARTMDDDVRNASLSVENLLPNESVQPISYDSLIILLETVEKEMERVLVVCKDPKRNYINPQSVIQSVKAVCALLGNVETHLITSALANLQTFLSSSNERLYNLEIDKDEGDYSIVKIGNYLNFDKIEPIFNELRCAIKSLLEMYSRISRVSFKIIPSQSKFDSTVYSYEITDSLLVHVDSIHRMLMKWSYMQYLITAQIYYGTRPVGQPVLSKPVSLVNKSSQRIVFDSWLSFDSTTINLISRESRIVFEVYGRNIVEEQIELVELGWAAIQLFDYNGLLTQGSYLLSLWPPEANKKLGPAPPLGSYSNNQLYPVIGIEIPCFGKEIKFPPVENSAISSTQSYDFYSLDINTQHQLLEIMEQDTFSNPDVEDREILWEKRHYLLKHYKALPKVLLATFSWDYTSLQDLYAMLHSWSPMDPVSALQLLLPCFPDCEVRRLAVKWIDELSSDRLIDYLPQLVEALKNETYETSELGKLLLKRSLQSPRFAHYLYWLLVHILPGPAPQNSNTTLVNNESISLSDVRYHKRMQLMLRALLAVSGESLRSRFMSQQLLVKGLTDVAELVKSSKENVRLNVLNQNLESIHSNLSLSPTCLPINPGLLVNGINLKMCSYFPSNTLPLKIYFTNYEGIEIPAIFKVGDNLQQDMLTLQMIRLMDKMWLKEGLDLKMVTFGCIPTGYREGIIEMVPDSDTLRKIQIEFGLTGSFKDRPIAEWLAKHNPSALEYERAVYNFTASCAGYCVATYILGICDRHNDNIMLKTTGHIFHIDFGKFLGDSQMFGHFKRDRAPFVLTSDMAYVINGSDKPSVKFQHFVDLCCQAFNILRKNGNVILNLFGLMASSGFGGLNVDSVRYIQNALLLQLSNAEAAASFARMIQNALKSWFTQFNFFLHNLAQLRFSIDHESEQLLSFVSKRYSMEQEGRIIYVAVYGCQKRYDPEKYYLYILRVERDNQPDSSFLFRSYKEFCEFQQKLCILYPLAKCHSLQSSSLQMGRSNIKQVADKRKLDVQKFLDSLFSMADEICHSDIVYTFFHPILRDQQENSINQAKLKDKKKDKSILKTSHVIQGHIKISMQYVRDTFRVMVHHVKDLAYVAGYQEPSTYVKVYLLPDHAKATKRKTKIVKRNCHPSFMEMLEYRMALERVENRDLQATVWNHDTLQENEFLGGITIKLSEFDLTKEFTDWYPLKNVHR